MSNDAQPLDVLSELERAGAVLLDRHFVYKSGKHGSGYINLDPLLPDAQLVGRICKELVAPFAADAIETIAAPAVGGIALAVLAAFVAGSKDRPVAGVWADKSGDDFAFDRAGFKAQLEGKSVLVVEDLLTTGGSVAKVCRAAEQCGARIIGVSAICNRGGVTAEQLGVARLESLADVSFDAWPADECPLCVQAVPIVSDIGHGATYRESHPDYPGGYVRLSDALA